LEFFMVFVQQFFGDFFELLPQGFELLS
jgi:hypothetical protein